MFSSAFRATLRWYMMRLCPHIHMKQTGGCYFFNLVTYRRQRFLADDISQRFLHEAIVTTRQKYPFAIDEWVLLPNHLHCIWVLS